MTARPEVAVVHDYLTQRGGAERVVLAMLEAFPGAPLYTALYEPAATYPEFAGHDVRTLWTNRLGGLRRHHRRGLPLYPVAFSGLRVDAEVALCSSSAFAHGVRCTGRKVVYCYTPARWLYDQAGTYLRRWPPAVRIAVRAAAPALRAWDGRAASTADAYLTSSAAARARIQAAYGIEAEVVPPPVPSPAGCLPRPVAGIAPGFVLCVSRLLAYKNVDAVQAAFALLPDARLVVVGDGPERSRLEATAGPNVCHLGRVDDAELSWLYANCAGGVAAAYEDFGLTVLEAASHGKPVAVLRFGGFVGTVVEGETGVFFEEPTGPDIAKAVQRLFEYAWDGEAIRRHAARFSAAAFAERLRAVVGLDLREGVASGPASAEIDLRDVAPSPPARSGRTADPIGSGQ